MTTSSRPEQPVRVGRKRDPSRDADILDAALLVLAEHGYDGMTMDMVAARAKAGKATVYRRWPSKAHMVVDAVARMSEHEIDLGDLPDTGTLRGDLTGLIRPEALADGDRRLKVLAAVATMLATQEDADLAQAASTASTSSWIDANRLLIERAVERGEIAAPRDVELLARVIPAMCYFRVTVQGIALDGEYVLSLIDQILLQTVGITPPGDTST